MCCFHTVPGVKDHVERECLRRKLLSHLNDSLVKFPSARLEHTTCWLSISSGVFEPPETSNAFRPYILYARDWCLCCAKGRTRGLKSCLPFRSRLLWVGFEFGRGSGGASSCSPQGRRLQFDPPPLAQRHAMLQRARSVHPHQKHKSEGKIPDSTFSRLTLSDLDVGDLMAASSEFM